jgi:two-component system NarL family sensor kinase
MESDTEQLQRRNRELSILNTIAEALNREVDLTHALRTALGHTVELFHLRTGWVWLLNEQTGEPYLAAAQHLPPGLVNEPGLMDGSCYCLDTFQAGDLEGAANVSVITCSRLKKLAGGHDDLRYHASIPLYAHRKQLGVLNVVSSDWRELSPDELRLLYTVGDLLSIAIERARLFSQSAQLGALEERNRIAREIHDTLAQGLSAIALQLETADALLEAGIATGRVRQAVERALILTRDSLEEARRSVLDLRAAPLEGRTLAEALPLLVEQLTAQRDIKVEYSITGADCPLPLRVSVGLYRVAQEAVTNVIRHANAGQLIIRLMIVPEHAELIIDDDGQGFDASHIPAGHFGLLGIRERVRLLNGTLSLSSAPSEGTRIEVIVPLV